MATNLAVTLGKSNLGASGLGIDLIPAIYQHEKHALGGYWSASFNVLGLTDSDVRLWAESAIGSHVSVQSVSGIVWEGVVDSLVITLENSTITIGSLMSISNRVSIKFQDIEAPFNLPVGGTYNATAWIQDSGSVLQYGALESVLSAGQTDTTAAASAANTYLDYNSWPIYDRQFTQQGGQQRGIVVNCVGYSRIMERRYYDNPGATGLVDISAKIADIISNADFVDSSSIASNTLQTYDEERELPTLLAAIQNLVSLGDASFNRYVFGMYANRKAIYRAVSSSPIYTVNSRGELLYPDNATPVDLANVDPGVRLAYSDIFSNQLPYGTNSLQGVDVNPIIETVSYTHPGSLSVTTGRTSRLEAIFAAYGLSGL